MGAFINLQGQRFGRLVAEEATKKNGRTAWICKCDCGNTCCVDTSNLRSGKQQSCGCLRKEKAKERKKDLTGQRFGRLVVLEDTDERQCGAIVWKCQCDCGNIVNVATGNLQTGHTQSCGCLNQDNRGQTRVRDLTGQKFGKLTALERVRGTKDIPSKWKCQCDCGNICYVPTECLTRENYTQSCGCIRSKGENRIAELLTENHIPFSTQKTFESCRFPNSHLLAKFDFYVNNKYLIEYDGEQHFYGWSCDKDNLRVQQYRDNYKNQWCQENNIPLIRIPFTKLKTLTIQDLLLQEENNEKR